MPKPCSRVYASYVGARRERRARQHCGGFFFSFLPFFITFVRCSQDRRRFSADGRNRVHSKAAPFRWHTSLQRVVESKLLIFPSRPKYSPLQSFVLWTYSLHVSRKPQLIANINEVSLFAFVGLVAYREYVFFTFSCLRRCRAACRRKEGSETVGPFLLDPHRESGDF